VIDRLRPTTAADAFRLPGEGNHNARASISYAIGANIESNRREAAVAAKA